MKFIVDEMLGRVAKWLRLFGYDTIYFKGDSDSELVFESIKQGRILLTRDTGISRKRPIKIIFIESENIFEQIEQLKRDLNLKISKDDIFTRCIKCNTSLEAIEKNKIKDKVPVFIFNTHNNFSYCSACKKVYWQGSHIELAEKLIKKWK
ncbi:MAG: Mut7-C RNAse domain-containing protein [Elusimicrobia bacterium]|nr:Mut7-C RNAse domain-containing protein [Elusimicrobiota bacterium]